MKKEYLDQLFTRFESLNVLVIGDVMIDAYLWGRVDRISPEAPVPVVHIQKRENRLGGAANVALNVQKLGSRAIICSVVGAGANGDVFRKTSKESGFSTEGIIDSPDRMTTVKTRVISQGHHIVRIDDEITAPLSQTDERILLECIAQILERQKVDVIILEDYNKGILTEKVIRTIIAWANERGIVTTVDPKKENFFTYEGCTLFKPNLKELKEGLKVDFPKSDMAALKSAVIRLHEQMKCRYTMVTLSELGIVTYDGTHFHHQPAFEREILDVSGAGDTVISVASLAIASGCTLEEAANLANLSGGLVCEKVGVVPVDKIKLLEEAKSHLTS